MICKPIQKLISDWFSMQIATLRAHKSFVKGVAWDPIGAYLASEGDDKAAVVYTTSSWEETDKLMDSLRVMDSTTHSTRLAWSPDGQYLALCNSRVPETSTYMAPIHRRTNGFVHENSFIGHSRAVAVVHFNPCFFKSPQGELEVVSAVADNVRSTLSALILIVKIEA
jgi:protein HIRA/HIR1